MLEFPFKEIYRRIARFDGIDEEKGSRISVGCGFFCLYNDRVFFVTKRSYVAVEERGFLPESIVLHIPTDSSLDTVETVLQLYDKEGKPIWRMLLQEPNDVLISIPLFDTVPMIDRAHCFLSRFAPPSLVYLPIHDTILSIPIPICLSLAKYVFYSDTQNEGDFRKAIEIDGEFRINRRDFARDMTEMVLVLLQHSLDKLSKTEKLNKTEEGREELESCLAMHDKLVSELEKIMARFADVLESTVFEKMQNIFSILMEHGLEDYLAARHLIRKVLLLLEQNILFAQ